MIKLQFYDAEEDPLNALAQAINQTDLAQSASVAERYKCSLPVDEWSFWLLCTVATHSLAKLLQAVSPILTAYIGSRPRFHFEIKDGSRVIRVRSLADLDAAVRAAKSLGSPAAPKAKASKSPKGKRKSSR